MRTPGTDPVAPETITSLFERLEDLLASQLGGLHFFSLQDELGQIAEIVEPGRDDLERAMVLARGEALNDFMESLTSPGWLAPMSAVGLFDAPTPAQVSADGGYRLPFWAPSRYLVRVAAAAPDAVTAVAVALPDTDNGRVHADIIDAACAMPTEHAARLAQLVPGYLSQPYRLVTAMRATTLATKLLAEGDAGAGCTWSRRCLRSRRTSPAPGG